MQYGISDMRKIGIGLTACGLAFTVLGIAFFFDKGMLSMGNVLFLAGQVFLTSPQRCVRFFFQKRRAKGSCMFFSGACVVLLGFPIPGMALEAFGFINLFGDFFPVVIAFLRRTPVIGNMLNLPGVKVVRRSTCSTFHDGCVACRTSNIFMCCCALAIVICCSWPTSLQEEANYLCKYGCKAYVI